MIKRHKFRTTGLAAIAALATASLGLLTAPAASAHSHSPGDHGEPSSHSQHGAKILSSEVLAPFQLALNHDNVYVADGFTGQISRVDKKGLMPIATDIPGLAGLDYTADGRTYAYTWSNDEHTAAGLTIRTRGKADVVADIASYEAAHNPDGDVTYGIVDGGSECAAAILEQATGGPATYSGIVDTHPYSVVRAGNRWVVADAGSNVLYSVSDRGRVSTLSVLPPQRVTFTSAMVAALAESQGAPADALGCLVGVTYAFEPVPTDVEVDPRGNLWVSLLPGGPEDASLGARGAVYRVNAWTGKASKVAGGFLGATNLAVAPNGTVYVAELFGGKISQIRHGHVSTFRTIASPLALEVHGAYLYVGTFADMTFPEDGPPVVNGPGTVQRFRR